MNLTFRFFNHLKKNLPKVMKLALYTKHVFHLITESVMPFLLSGSTPDYLCSEKNSMGYLILLPKVQQGVEVGWVMGNPKK